MYKRLFFFQFILLLFSACSQNNLEKLIDESLDKASRQALFMANDSLLHNNRLPRTLGTNGTLRTTDCYWWCSGFYPGVLWYLYEYNHSPEMLEQARNFTERIRPVQYLTDNHDVGFMLYCSFGNGYRLTNDYSYYDVLINGAKSLSTRYKENMGLIRSWDFNKDHWQYPVIIDNMMNLELLLWASAQQDNPQWHDIALNHADKTMQHHFRDDYSCYHVVSYDTISAMPEKKETWQGENNESAWARGQGWALYGYTYMYRETGNAAYLKQARGIADYICNHPRLPQDGIPYWDFDAPDIPNAKRDASAAAIICSALIELSDLPGVSKQDSITYITLAEKQLRTLSSPEYLAEPSTNGGFILKHSVGFMHQNSEVDVPLTYADYYYVEALMRMKKKLQGKSKINH